MSYTIRRNRKRQNHCALNFQAHHNRSDRLDRILQLKTHTMTKGITATKLVTLTIARHDRQRTKQIETDIRKTISEWTPSFSSKQRSFRQQWHDVLSSTRWRGQTQYPRGDNEILQCQQSFPPCFILSFYCPVVKQGRHGALSGPDRQ